MSTNGQKNISVVRAFFETTESLKLEDIMGYFTEDAIYQNMPMPPATGKAQVRDHLKFLLGGLSSFNVEILNIADNQGVVFTERVDTLKGRGIHLRLPVTGTMVVQDGKIASWKDYFDWFTLGLSILKGIPLAPFRLIQDRLPKKKK